MKTTREVKAETVTGSKSNNILLSDIRVTPAAVMKKLKELNQNKAQGLDLVPPKGLKELSEQLALPLCILFNKTLELGQIPTD